MADYFIQAQKRDSGKCVYCGFDLLESLETFWCTQMDHLIPQRQIAALGNSLASHDVFRAEGGVSFGSLGNYVTACACCNSAKGKYVPPDWESMTRDQMIEAVREHITVKRRQKMEQYLERVRIVRG